MGNDYRYEGGPKAGNLIAGFLAGVSVGLWWERYREDPRGAAISLGWLYSVVVALMFFVSVIFMADSSTTTAKVWLSVLLVPAVLFVLLRAFAKRGNASKQAE